MRRTRFNAENYVDCFHSHHACVNDGRTKEGSKTSKLQLKNRFADRHEKKQTQNKPNKMTKKVTYGMQAIR